MEQIDMMSGLVMCITTLCFGLLFSLQLAHIYYRRRLAVLAKRCVNTGTLAPILIEAREIGNADKKE